MPSLTVSLKGDRSYSVYAAPLREVPARMAEAGLHKGRCLVVTDEHVAAHYRAPLETALRAEGWAPRVVVVAPGERTKAAAPLGALYDEALAWGVDRQTPVVALGGGVVGDLAGFAAATLLRGLPLVQVPTSLVAQVDSSLGGKTGINHARGKNLVGAFWQPALVVADPATLQTLPEREWQSGLAEVVKHALISGDPGSETPTDQNAPPSLRSFLEDRGEAVAARRGEAVAALVPRAARVKARIVEADEREAGPRAVLNFGHTFGHAIERVAGYGRVTHGEAVALGMRAALALSQRVSGLPEEEAARARRLTHFTEVPAAAGEASLEALREAMQSDKKNVGRTVRFVLLRRLGAPHVTGDVPAEALEAAWASARSSIGAGDPAA